MSAARLRHLVRLRVEKSDEVRPLLTLDQIESGTGMVSAMVLDGEPDGQIKFEPGDVLFSKLRPYLAKSLLVQEPSHGTGELLALVPGDRLDARFLLYTTLSKPWLDLADLTSYGTKMPRTSWEAMADYRFPDLPLEVQRRIADFLDDQTARIDHIITARQQQIELAMLALDSKWSSSFQELASQSPNPRLRCLVESISDGPFGSALKSSDYTDSGVRVIRLGNVGINSFKDWDRAFVSQEYGFSLSQHSVRAGDVIMAGLGDDKWPLGRCAVVPSDLGEAINKADCYRVRVGPSVSPEYVAWAVSAPPSRSALALLARGATRSRLNTQVAGDLAVPLPPPSVQRHVVSEWKRLSAMAEEAIAAAAHAQALLQELKRSLISAAVAGEFDVSSADGSRVVV